MQEQHPRCFMCGHEINMTATLEKECEYYAEFHLPLVTGDYANYIYCEKCWIKESKQINANKSTS